jgi:RND family efflux transporter MFP subunit
VLVQTPTPRQVTRYLQYTGITEASETVELRARVQGFLEKVNFAPGQMVKKGDVLFVIDQRPFKLEVDKAKAALAAARADLLAAENDAKVATELATSGAGSDIDRILKVAKRDASKAAVASAEAAVANAELDLSYCTVTSPLDGLIGKNMVDTGNLVGRSDATLLATVVANKPIFANIDAAEADTLPIRRSNQEALAAGKIKPGQTADGKWRVVEMGLSDQDGYPITGRIDYVEPSLNAASGTIRIRTRFENEDSFLLPGQFTRIRVPVEQLDTMVLPEASVLSDQSGRFVMVVDDKNIVGIKRVKTGPVIDNQIAILSGLTTTDRVITTGIQKARPGSPVTPKPAGAPAATGGAAAAPAPEKK